MATRRFKRITIDFDNSGVALAVEALIFTEMPDPNNVLRTFSEQSVEKETLAEMGASERAAVLAFISATADPMVSRKNPLTKTQAEVDAEAAAAAAEAVSK